MKEALKGIVRHAITTIAGTLVGSGIVSSSEVEVITGVVMALIGVALSVGEKALRKRNEV